MSRRARAEALEALAAHPDPLVAHAAALLASTDREQERRLAGLLYCCQSQRRPLSDLVRALVEVDACLAERQVAVPFAIALAPLAADLIEHAAASDAAAAAASDAAAAAPICRADKRTIHCACPFPTNPDAFSAFADRVLRTTQRLPGLRKVIVTAPAAYRDDARHRALLELLKSDLRAAGLRVTQPPAAD